MPMHQRMVAPRTSGEAVPAAARVALARLASGGWPTALPDVLAEVAAAAGAQRAYVFQNRRGPDGRLWMDLVGEWDAPGVRPIFDDPKNHLHPYFPHFSRWIEVLGVGGFLHTHVGDLDGAEAQVLAEEGTASLLIVPVTVGGEWWGYVGVDACGEERTWGDDDRSVLRALASAVDLGGRAHAGRRGQAAARGPLPSHGRGRPGHHVHRRGR